VTDNDPTAITRLLHEWQDGSSEAFDRLVPMVYEELRTIASRHLAREWRHDHLQTTAVVSEAYLRLFGQRDVDWQNRGHFFAIAAQQMRRILVDHARRERREKRGGGCAAVPLDDRISASDASVDVVDALDLDRALQKLEGLDPGAAKIVELRFFGGLTIEETAAALGISPATVKREWAIAKGWLHRELTGEGAADAS
jgi:RNA polymerase sigma factor (TIGR02999 family)